MAGNREGKCAKCDFVGRLTVDHIVPRWILHRMHSFGVDMPRLSKLKKRDPGFVNTQLLCQRCNNRKGGSVDFSYPEVRMLMSELADAIYGELKKHDKGP